MGLFEQNQTSNVEKDKRPPRPPSVHLLQKDSNGSPEDRVPNDLHGVYTDKPERRQKNKDRPDRGVWAPLRRSDSAHASDDSLSSQSALDSAEGTLVEWHNLWGCLVLNLTNFFWDCASKVFLVLGYNVVLN